MLSELLTIMVPLKGRESYTEKFLQYCKKINCPFKIVFADGTVDKTGPYYENGKLKCIKNYLKKLDIKYFYEYQDNTVSDFNNKMSDIMTKVETPFVVKFDNDDFFSLNGIIQNLNYLNKNVNIDSSRGNIIEVVYHENEYKYIREMYNRKPIIKSTAKERVDEILNEFSPIWHNTQRTETAIKIHQIISACNINCFKSQHRLVAYLSACFGNINRDESFVYYAHQSGTPRQPGNYLPLDKDWVQKDDWEENISKLLTAVGQTIACIDKIPAKKAKYDFCEEFLTRMVNNTDLAHKPDYFLGKELLKKIDYYVDLSESSKELNKNISGIVNNKLNLDFEEVYSLFNYIYEFEPLSDGISNIMRKINE